MTGPEVTDLLAAVGGLGGLGALITSLATLVKTRQVHDDTSQLRPDHGSSVADKVDLVLDLTRSHGHQIGEIRKELDAERDDRQELDRRAQAEHSRIWKLLEHPMGYPWET